MLSIKRSLESPYTSLVITIVCAALSFEGKLSQNAALFLFCVAACLSLHALRRIPPALRIPSYFLVTISFIALAYWATPEKSPAAKGLMQSPHHNGISLGKGVPIFIHYGPVLTIVYDKDKVWPFRDVLDEPFLEIENDNGHLAVSTIIRDKSGAIVAEITKNEWAVSPSPRTWDRNYDENALEVIDPYGKVVLKVELNLNHVFLEGEWRSSDGHGLRIASGDRPDVAAVMAKFAPSEDSPYPPIYPMFAYPSESHFGQRCEPNRTFPAKRIETCPAIGPH